MQLFRFPLYPILFALFPILFLYVHNIEEVTIDVIWLPVLVSTFVSCVTLLVGKFIFKSWHKSAVLVLLIILVFFSYGRFVSLLPVIDVQDTFIPLGTDSITLAVLGVMVVSAGYLLWRSRSLPFYKVNNVLNMIGLVLVSFSIVQILPTEINRIKDNNADVATVSAETIGQSQDGLPDVYYLVFDRYAGNKTIQELYHFDNRQIHDYLRDEGFYVAEKSTANYAKTSFSLSSSLNMKYHEEFDSSTNQSYPTEVTDIYPQLKVHNVGEEFKRRGYEFIQLGSWYWQTVQSGGIADQSYSLAKQQDVMGVDPFVSRLLTTTAALPVIEKLRPEMLQIDNYRSHYLSTEYQRIKIKDIIAQNDRPKFVFVHMLVPHSPFVFNNKCQYIDESISKDALKIQRYVDMVQCANVLIKEMIEEIRNGSAFDPVIIIQADEGAYPIYDWKSGDNPYESEEIGRLHERFRIQNAYYFPNGDYSQLYQEITPVNSFRVLMNNLFGSDYELLPDKNYQFKSPELKFNFVDVTGDVLGK